MRTGYIICSLILLSGGGFNSLVEAVTPTNLWCGGTSLKALRIQGCNVQPCPIRKGHQLPMEIDLTMDKPVGSADGFDFVASIPYYAVPPSVYGSDLSRANCEDGNTGFGCPISNNVQYTLKRSLYIDPRAVCTAGCDGMEPGGTGLRDTQWRWTIYNGLDYVGSCSFDITLNIVI